MYFDSAATAYNFINRNYKIPAEMNWVNNLLSQTCVTTLVWKILFDLQMVESRHVEDLNYWAESSKLRFDKPYSNIEMAEIKQLAEKANARFLLVAITDYLDNPKIRTPSTFPGLFEDIKYTNSPVAMTGYNMKDGHFNNTGHKIYADYLQTLIEAK